MRIEWLPSFNAGELDPRMDARAGLEKYQSGCRVLKNFIPVPFGGVSKRPGTMFLSEVHDSGRKARLEPFRFSTTTQYLIEFGHKTMRFMGDMRVVTNIGEFTHVAPWKLATAYPIGSLVLDAGVYHRATVAHTATDANKFDAVPWKTVRSLTRAWAVGLTFAPGDVCSYAISATDTGLFECKLANTASLTNVPTALATNTVWLRLATATPYWSTGTAYPARNGVAGAYARTPVSGLPVPFTYTRATTVVTVTKTAHGLSVGDLLDLETLTGGALSGIYAVATVPTADTLTFATVASGTIAAGTGNYATLPAFSSVAATYARSTTTVTMTKTAHGLATGDSVLVDFTSGGALDGTYTVTGVPTADTFTFTTVASGTIAGGSTATYVKLSEFAAVAATYARATTTVTITKAAHGLVVGEWIRADFTSGGALDGVYQIATVPTANTFTVTTVASGTIAAGSTLNFYPRSAPGSYYRAGQTVKVTKIAHGFQAGDVLSVHFITGGAADGAYTVVASLDVDHFTFTTAATGTIAPGNTLQMARRELWQCEIANTADSNNDPGGSPPWIVAVPGAEIPFVVTTPWSEDEIFDVYCQQINDIVLLCHPSHPIQVLTRTHSDFFTLEAADWDWPPLRDENVDGTIKLTPSGTTGTITLTSSADVFDVDNVGSDWALAWAAAGRNSEIKVNSTAAATYTSPMLRVAGRWNAYSFNYWDGIFEIHRSFDDFSTFEVIRSYKSSNGDRNFNTSGEEARECTLRLKFTGQRFAYTGGAAYDAHAVIEVIDHREWGLVKITAVTNPTTATATVTRTLPYNTATAIWAEGAFSDRRGYPRTVCFHAGRLFYGGNEDEPLRIWGSVTDDFFNFRRSSLADGSIAATIASVARFAIQWMASGTDSLLVGTQGREYVVGGQGDAPMGPGNIIAHPQSAYGSAYMAPLLVNYVTLFVQRSRLTVREFVYSLERNGFVAADMTKLASHIVNPGLRQWAFQQAFDAIVWAVTSDGVLVGLTYEREENVVGWHRHETDGTFESVAILYGAEGGSDEIYLVSKRVVNGVERRYIEVIQPDAYEQQRDGHQEECVMSDCALVTRGTDLAEITGLSHLEGKTVQVLADGGKRTDATVSGGKITLDATADVVIVGLQFEAMLKPMKLELPMQDGTAQTRTFKLHKLALRVFQSLGGQMRSDDAADWQTLVYRDTTDPMGTAPGLYTGEKELSMDSRSKDSLDFTVRSIDPHPLTIIALAPKFDVSGTSANIR